MKTLLENLKRSFLKDPLQSSFEHGGELFFLTQIPLAPTFEGQQFVDIFKKATIFPKVLFRERNKGHYHLGLGKAIIINKEEISLIDQMETPLFSMLPFFSQFKGEEWDKFKDFNLFVPEITFSDNLIYIVTKHRIARDQENILEKSLDLILKILEGPTRSATESLEINSQQFQFQFNLKKIVPEFEQFKSLLDEFKSTSNMNKVVLARKKTYSVILKNELEKSLSHSLLDYFLGRYFDQENRGKEESFLFIIAINQNHAFISTTPELLFEKEKREISIDSLAGTRTRGKNSEEDSQREKELFESPKETLEQEIVTRGIKESLEHLASFKSTSHEKFILKLSHLMHLKSQIRGELKEEAGKAPPIDSLIKALHPTAAVGGHPQKLAVEFLDQKEYFDRGLYAGPLGFIKKDKAIFVVGIRSALIEKDLLHLFAGAGILRDSKASQEWQEMESKFEHMEKYFFKSV